MIFLAKPIEPRKTPPFHLITRIISYASFIITSLILESAPDKNMLGEQIAELKGKMMSQRVLDAERPTIEISVSTRGSVRGTQVNESLTYVARPTSAGVLHGEGQGVIMTGDSEMAAYTGEGIGRFTASGTKWRGAIYYSTSSTGKLSFLNNVVGVYEAEMDAEGNFTEKIWEWK